MNSLPTIISLTVMRSLSIIGVIKYEKLSSDTGKTGMIVTLNKFRMLNYYFTL